MPLHRFFCNPIVEPTTELGGTEARHLCSVLRLGPGDKVELFDGAGSLATATISTIKKSKVIVGIEHIQHIEPPKSRRIIIAASIAKGERFDWLIEKCTELGVDRICPVLFERTVKQPKNPKSVERWRNLAVSAAKQCKRLFLPDIDPPMSLPDVLHTLRKDYPDARILLGVLSAGSQPLANLPFGSADTIAFIGPEGGLTEQEGNLLKKTGAIGVCLTDTVLRVETAALAFASILTAQRGALEK
jgi:16S rRNA (uracil1498-N3)-methyltransferase